MKSLYSFVLIILGVTTFAQINTNLTKLKSERFSQNGFIDNIGIEHKILIEKPAHIYNQKQYTINEFNKFFSPLNKKIFKNNLKSLNQNLTDQLKFKD